MARSGMAGCAQKPKRVLCRMSLFLPHSTYTVPSEWRGSTVDSCGLADSALRVMGMLAHGIAVCVMPFTWTSGSDRPVP